jgi:hypothetical protein
MLVRIINGFAKGTSDVGNHVLCVDAQFVRSDRVFVVQVLVQLDCGLASSRVVLVVEPLDKLFSLKGSDHLLCINVFFVLMIRVFDILDLAVTFEAVLIQLGKQEKKKRGRCEHRSIEVVFGIVVATFLPVIY